MQNKIDFEGSLSKLSHLFGYKNGSNRNSLTLRNPQTDVDYQRIKL